jgi:hypothetical protein
MTEVWQVDCRGDGCYAVAQGTEAALAFRGWCLVDYGRSAVCPAHGGARLLREEYAARADLMRACYPD